MTEELKSKRSWVDRMGFAFMLFPFGLGIAAMLMGGKPGLLAIVFAHCFLYMGFVARAISSLIRHRTLSGVEFAYTLAFGIILGILGPVVYAAR